MKEVRRQENRRKKGAKNKGQRRGCIGCWKEGRMSEKKGRKEGRQEGRKKKE